MQRREAEAIAWASEVMGAPVVSKSLQGRWRPHWTLELGPGARDGVRKVLLRGFRNPGYTEIDESGVRARLELEAGILQALQDAPVRTPRFLGYNGELGCLLMEFVEGEAELTGLEDKDRQARIYRSYMEQLAQLHAHPIDRLKLPSGFDIPASARDFRRRMVESHVGFYRSLERRRPEATLELALRWVIDTDLPDERPVCLGLGDVGPDQFLFRDDDVAALIDVEYAIAGDPLYEIGKMRGRNLLYHIEGMPEHIRYYGECYERLTGIPLSIPSLNFWTIAGPALRQVYTVAGAQKPSATTIDTAFMFSYEVIMKRRVTEGLAQHYGLTLTPPELEETGGTTLGRLHDVIVGQLAHYYPARMSDGEESTFVRYSQAIAQTLRRGDACHLKLEGDNLEELGELLGQRPRSVEDGLRRLEALIAEDYQHDLPRRLGFLYRYERRREFLYEPMQRATGVAHAVPLEAIANPT